MPAAPPGKVYEVWVERGTEAPEPTDALFSATKRGAGSVAVPGDLHGASACLSPPSRSAAASTDAHACNRRQSLSRAKRRRGRSRGYCDPPAERALPWDEPARLWRPWPPATATRARETGGLLLQLRTPDLPRLHDHYAGRHALPGVRAPAHKVAHDARRWRGSAPGHQALIAHERDRVPDRGQSQFTSPAPTSTAGCSRKASSGATAWGSTPVLASREQRFLHATSCTSASTCTCSTARALLEPAIGSLRFVDDLLHGAARRLLRRLVRDCRARASAPPARSSA